MALNQSPADMMGDNCNLEHLDSEALRYGCGEKTRLCFLAVSGIYLEEAEGLESGKRRKGQVVWAKYRNEEWPALRPIKTAGVPSLSTSKPASYCNERIDNFGPLLPYQRATWTEWGLDPFVHPIS